MLVAVPRNAFAGLHRRHCLSIPCDPPVPAKSSITLTWEQGATPNAACDQRVPNSPIRLGKASASSAQSADLFLPTKGRLLPANRRPKPCSLHKARVVVAYVSCRMGKLASQRGKEARDRPGGGGK